MTGYLEPEARQGRAKSVAPSFRFLEDEKETVMHVLPKAGRSAGSSVLEDGILDDKPSSPESGRQPIGRFNSARLMINIANLDDDENPEVQVQNWETGEKSKLHVGDKIRPSLNIVTTSSPNNQARSKYGLNSPSIGLNNVYSPTTPILTPSQTSAHFAFNDERNYGGDQEYFSPPTPSHWGDYGTYPIMKSLMSPTTTKMDSLDPVSLVRAVEEEEEENVPHVMRWEPEQTERSASIFIAPIRDHSMYSSNNRDHSMHSSNNKWESSFNERVKVNWDKLSSCVDPGEVRDDLEELGDSDVKPITTMMVRNVPRRQTQEQLEAHLRRTGFKGEYDVLYLPYCFRKKQNLGYAFINFITTEKALEFHLKWHKQKLNQGPKSRPVNVSIAQIQGREANVQLLLKDSKMCNNPDLQPILYDLQGNRIQYTPFNAAEREINGIMC